jgi:hypothetical protein
MTKLVSIFASLVFLVLLCDSSSGQVWSTNEIAIKISKISYSGEITISIANTSSKPVRIWEEANSWGRGRWRIFVFREGHLQTFFQNPAQEFTVNFPSFREIAPGAQIEEKLNPNDNEWCSLGHRRNSYPLRHTPEDDRKTNFQPGDLIIVDYDVPCFLPESRRLHVWWGVAADSATVQ